MLCAGRDVPLGCGACVSLYKWQEHDPGLILPEARKQNAPMIIGPARDAGTNKQAVKCVESIRDPARGHNPVKFKIACFYSEA